MATRWVFCGQRQRGGQGADRLVLHLAPGGIRCIPTAITYVGNHSRRRWGRSGRLELNLWCSPCNLCIPRATANGITGVMLGGGMLHPAFRGPFGGEAWLGCGAIVQRQKAITTLEAALFISHTHTHSPGHTHTHTESQSYTHREARSFPYLCAHFLCAPERMQCDFSSCLRSLFLRFSCWHFDCSCKVHLVQVLHLAAATMSSPGVRQDEEGIRDQR